MEKPRRWVAWTIAVAATVALLVAVAGGIGMRSALMALMLPTLAWRFAGDVAYYWGFHWRYSAMLMPIAFAALLEVADRWPRLRHAAIALSLTATFVVATTGHTVLKVFDPDFRQDSPHRLTAQRVLDTIPHGATVVSDLTLLAYLVPHAEVYWIGNDNPAPDYHVISGQPPTPDGDEPLSDRLMRDFGATYAVVFEEDGFVVHARTGADD